MTLDLNTASGPRRLPPMKDLREDLRDRSEELFRAYWGEPSRPGASDWRAKEDTARHMEMRGADRGAWADHKSGAKGGPLEFFAIYAMGWDGVPSDIDGRRTLRAEVARWLGIDVSAPVSEAELSRRNAERAQKEAQRAAEAAEHEEAEKLQRAAVVRAVRAAAQPIEGTAAEIYLRSRGIDLWPADQVSYVPPGALHYQKGILSGEHSALVIWGRNDAGEIVAGQRVLIDSEGRRVLARDEEGNIKLDEDGKPQKAAKPSFAAIGGAPARLPALNSSTDLIVAEGPETALSIWMVTGCETWAVFGAGQFKDAPLPFNRRVILAPDQDAPDSSAARAFEAAVEKHSATHPDLWITRAPEPVGSKKDLNDTLMRAGAEAVLAAIAAAVRVDSAPVRTAQPQQIRGRAGQFTGQGAVECPPPVAPLFISPDDGSRVIEREARRWFDAAAKWDAEREGEPPRHAVAASAGTGKSTTARAVLASLDLSVLSGDVIWHSPTINLAAEGAGHAASLGSSGHVTLGRSAINPATGEPMCARHETAEEVAKAGLAVFPTLCKREMPKVRDEMTGEMIEVEPVLCPHFATCAHRRQWDELKPGPTLRFEAHSYITLSGDGSGRKVAARVIDETFLGHLTRQADLSREDMVAPRRPRSTGTQQQRTEAALIAADLPRAASEVWDAVVAGLSPVLIDYSAEELEAFADVEDPAPVLTSDPSKPDAEILAELRTHKAYDPKAGARAALWRVLADCKRRGLEATERVRLVRNEPIKGSAEKRDVIRVLWRALPPDDVPLLILDADMTRPILEALYPNAELANIALRPNAFVVQVTDRTFSKSKLMRPEVRREAIGLVRVEAYRDRLSGGRGTLAVATRKVVRWIFEDAGHDFTGKTDAEISQIMRSTVLHGARWLWFGPASLGLNEFEDFGTVVIIGREEMSHRDIEDIARALYGDTGEPLGLIEDAENANYPEVLIPYLMRDGSGWGVMARAHPDRRVRGLQEQYRERATLQAIERLRLARAMERKRVVIACKVPIPGLPVDELVRWEDIAPSRLTTAMAEAAERGGTLRLSKAGLAADAPQTFKDAQAAHDWLRQGGKEQIEAIKGGTTGNNDPITGYPPFNPIAFELRLQGQRGQMTPALAVLPGDIRAMVEAQIGLVAELRLPPGAAHSLGKGEVEPSCNALQQPAPADGGGDTAARVKRSDDDGAAHVWAKGEIARFQARLAARPNRPLEMTTPDQVIRPEYLSGAERRRERALRCTRVARMRGPQVAIWAAE